MAGDVDVDDISLGRASEVEQRPHCRHRNRDEDHRRNDRPHNLQWRVAVNLLGLAVVVLALPEPEYGKDESSLNDDEDDGG